MIERRSERRLMCSDLVAVQLDQGPTVAAVLEDITPSGACLGMEQRDPFQTSGGKKMVFGKRIVRFRLACVNQKR
jgi:hypothetical protein